MEDGSLVVDLDIKPCYSLGWVAYGKEQMGQMCEFHFTHVDPKHLRDVQEERLHMEAQVSVALQWCRAENCADS